MSISAAAQLVCLAQARARTFLENLSGQYRDQEELVACHLLNYQFPRCHARLPRLIQLDQHTQLLRIYPSRNLLRSGWQPTVHVLPLPPTP